MEKIVIRTGELPETAPLPLEQPRLEPKLQPPVPLWARLAMSPLVLILPLLCLATLALRIAMRGLPPRTRYAWISFLCSLMIFSGILTSIVSVLAIAFVPLPVFVNSSLNELDERDTFPKLPVATPLSARDVAEQLKPLVVVISPARQKWFSKEELPSNGFGAGVILEAGTKGYLVMTAKHVIHKSFLGNSYSRALVTMMSGIWAGADVVGCHKDLDLCLLWLPRESGSGSFTQSLRDMSDVSEGENIFVIGHPQGLRYTLSTGIISRKAKDAFQLTAPISPGNSGGPVFDDRGNLVGIVTSMIDRNANPNAENLNFAVRANAVLDPDGWDFSAEGKIRLEDFIRRLHAKSSSTLMLER
jgi:hypothetical protein